MIRQVYDRNKQSEKDTSKELKDKGIMKFLHKIKKQKKQRLEKIRIFLYI